LRIFVHEKTRANIQTNKKETKKKPLSVGLEDYSTRCVSCPGSTMSVMKIGWLPALNATVEARQVLGIQENYAQNALEQED
jgi:hypothetical protein